MVQYGWTQASGSVAVTAKEVHRMAELAVLKLVRPWRVVVVISPALLLCGGGAGARRDGDRGADDLGPFRHAGVELTASAGRMDAVERDGDLRLAALRRGRRGLYAGRGLV